MKPVDRRGLGTTNAFASAQDLHRRGDLVAARALYEKIGKRHPDYPRALHYLGLIAHQSGDSRKAVRLIGKALTLTPKDPEMRSNLGNALARCGRLEEARKELERAVALAPDFAGGFNNLGLCLRKLGQPGRAADAFAQAVRLMPRQALLYTNWGSALAEMSLLEAAQEKLEIAIALDPKFAEAWNNLGLVQSRRRAWDAALASLETAAKLAPNAANVWVNLSTVERAFGRLDKARQAAEKALALAPDLPDAHQALAAAGRSENAEAEIARLERLLKSDSLTAAERSNSNFALGKLLDEVGNYASAFAAYKAANRDQASPFDPEATAERLEALTERFGSAFAQRLSNLASASERPVFVIGMPRSGTTLVEQIIASHPQAAGAGELGDIERFLLACEEREGDPSAQQVTAFIADYLETLERYGPGAARVVDKRPFNFLALGLIAALFPKARIVHCRRDPRDTSLSIFFTNFADKHGFSTRLKDIGRFYRDYDAMMARWRTLFPDRLYEISYSALIADQEHESRALIAHLGLAWDPACLAFHQTLRPVDTPSDWQVRQPLTDRSLGRWRHYEAELAPLLEALGPLAQAPRTPA